MTAVLNQRKCIGNTDIAVSPLGLGTVKIGRNKAVKYPQGFKIPDDKEVAALLSQAWESGINLIDTAPAYGNSEQRLGEILPQLPHDWVIATKAGEYFDNETGKSHYDFTPESLIQSVEASLKHLRRDYLDIVLLHSDGHDVEIIQQGALQVLAELKQKGLIRATGISSKTVDGGVLGLQQADIAMVMHTPEYQDEQAVLDYAVTHHKAIFVKKALASGHITQQADVDPVQASFNFIFSEPAVTSVIVGTISPVHLKENVEKAVLAMQGQK